MEETTPDCPATVPRGPGNTLLSRARDPAALSPIAASFAPATIHRGPPRSQPCIQQYIIVRGPALHRSQYRWGNRVADSKNKHGILATALGDSTASYDVNKHYMCVCYCSNHFKQAYGISIYIY